MNKIWQPAPSAALLKRLMTSGRPLTDLPFTTSSRSEPKGSWPNTPTTKGASALANAAAGHSTKREKLKRNTALTWYSVGAAVTPADARRPATTSNTRAALSLSFIFAPPPRSRRGILACHALQTRRGRERLPMFLQEILTIVRVTRKTIAVGLVSLAGADGAGSRESDLRW